MSGCGRTVRHSPAAWPVREAAAAAGSPGAAAPPPAADGCTPVGQTQPVTTPPLAQGQKITCGIWYHNVTT